MKRDAYILKGIIRKQIFHYFQTYKMIQTSTLIRIYNVASDFTSYHIRNLGKLYYRSAFFFNLLRQQITEQTYIYLLTHPHSFTKWILKVLGRRVERNHWKLVGTWLSAKQWPGKGCICNNRGLRNPINATLSLTKHKLAVSNSWGQDSKRC